LKKFEPRYRLVRIGLGTKLERASRQQRTFWSLTGVMFRVVTKVLIGVLYRQTAQEQTEDSTGYG